MAKNLETQAPSRNTLGCGTKLKGEIESNGDFRIDGTLVGTIKTDGKVVVGSTGKVEGTIICQNADVEGVVKAKLNVSGLLTLKEKSKLEGDVSTGKLAIEPGAQFSGSCKMGEQAKTTNVPEMNGKK
jgi:cytoskeletal protein CcmA (bactofilin family)